MKKITQWLAPPLALLVLAGVVFITASDMNSTPPGPPPVKNEIRNYPDVTVMAVEELGYNAVITGLGESEPHYKMTLAAEISARVEELNPNFETGQILKKGDILVWLEDIEYRAAVAAAKSDLAQSRLDLLEEERQVTQALSDWGSSGLEGEPDSKLVLRQPQLTAALAAVETAQVSLELARKNIGKTKITAPFDCLVVSRQATPGSYLQAGSEIASLYSIDKVEIAVPLSSSEWDNLPQSSEIPGHPVTVIGVEDGRTWQGKISRLERHVDTKTRQRRVIVEIDEPLSLSEQLLSGTFVRVEISGKRVDKLWKLPGSALSQRGEIWYVTDQNSLAAFSAEPVFSDDTFIYVQPPEDLAGTTREIVVHPLASYLVGMKINPLQEETDEQS